MIIFVAGVPSLAAEGPLALLGPLLAIAVMRTTDIVWRSGIPPSPAPRRRIPRHVSPVCVVPSAVSRPFPRSGVVVPAVPMAVAIVIIFPMPAAAAVTVSPSAAGGAGSTFVATAVRRVAAPAVI